MGLEHIEIPMDRMRPSPTVTRMLGELVQGRSVDVVHAHEWPPIIEAFLGVNLPERAAVVGTVMSMTVAPFLPRTVPLTVGTEMIRQSSIAAGHRHVTLLEPPVDTQADHPSANGDDFRIAHGIGPDEILVAMICRLVPDLKLEGLLSACEAIGEMTLKGEPVRLMIIGDGPARAQVAACSAKVNAAVGQRGSSAGRRNGRSPPWLRCRRHHHWPGRLGAARHGIRQATRRDRRERLQRASNTRECPDFPATRLVWPWARFARRWSSGTTLSPPDCGRLSAAAS